MGWYVFLCKKHRPATGFRIKFSRSPLLNVNTQVSVFTDTIMNIFENFIQHKTITCDEIKALLKQKNTLYKHLLRKTLNASFSEKFIALQSKLQNSIKLSKTEYYKKTLQNDLTQLSCPKCYWFNGKRIPCIPIFSR